MADTDTSMFPKYRWKFLVALIATAAVAAPTVNDWRGSQGSAERAPAVEQVARQARANLDEARWLVRRHQVLFENGLIDRAALEESRNTLEYANAQFRMALEQLAQRE
jgi:multidrug resistance efflux pump